MDVAFSRLRRYQVGRYNAFPGVGLCAFSFSNDTSFRSPHGWPDRCAFGRRPRLFETICSAGGQATAHYRYERVHLDFPEQCESVRVRKHYHISCGFGVRTYNATRDAGARATDDVIAVVADIPHLVEVDLCGTAVTDVALEHLVELPDLLFINVYGTAISPDAVNAFKRRRPDVRVELDDPIGFDSDDDAI